MFPTMKTVRIENLIPSSEACTILGVSRPALTNMVRENRLTVALTLSNGQLLFDRTAVEQYAKERVA